MSRLLGSRAAFLRAKEPRSHVKALIGTIASLNWIISPLAPIFDSR
jgi:hypothetical protein